MKFITCILLSFALSVSCSTSADSRLQNLAIRSFIGTGDNVLIGGLVISGNESKTVIIRARGPFLTSVGVNGALSDPQMTLFQGASVIDSNNDWPEHANADLIPEHLRPSDTRESVIATTLAPGAYTVIVNGLNQEQGIGIVEIFELEDTGATLIQNIATRGFVGTGDNVMIGGLVISGLDPKKVKKEITIIINFLFNIAHIVLNNLIIISGNKWSVFSKSVTVVIQFIGNIHEISRCCFL